MDQHRVDFELSARPTDEDFKTIVIEILKSTGKPLRFVELWNMIREKGFYISDNRLKDILRDLIVKDILMEFPDGTVGFPEWSRWYIPRRDVKRVKPITPHKFYKLYGNYASKIRRMGLPVEEALRIARYSFGKSDSYRKPRGGVSIEDIQRS
jgi:hypothetical protein